MASELTLHRRTNGVLPRAPRLSRCGAHPSDSATSGPIRPRAGPFGGGRDVKALGRDPLRGPPRLFGAEARSTGPREATVLGPTRDLRAYLMATLTIQQESLTLRRKLEHGHGEHESPTS